MSVDFQPGPVEASMRARAVEARRRLFNSPAPRKAIRLAPPLSPFHPKRMAESISVEIEATPVSPPTPPATYEQAAVQVDEAIDGQRRKVTCRQIIAEVCLARGVHPRDLYSMSRSRPIVAVRQECCWRIRNEVLVQGRQISLPEIGRQLGGLDHTTVLHSIRKFDAMKGAV